MTQAVSNTLRAAIGAFLVAGSAFALPASAADQAGAPASGPAMAPPGGHDMGGMGCNGGHGPMGGEGGMRHGPGMMHGGPMGPMGMDGVPPWLHGLDLSEAQRDKIFSILHAAAPQLRERAKAAEKAHKEFHALATAEAVDDARLRSAADAVGRSMAEMALLHVKTERQVRAVLTPEQRKQADERRAARHDGHEGHDGGRGRPHAR